MTAVLEEHAQDVAGGVFAAVEHVLTAAEADPLLRGILTSARAGDDDLLPLLTTRSAPVLAAATRTLTSWFRQNVPELDPEDVADSADALARLAVSHLVLPAEDRATTARRLARIALRCVGADQT